MDGACSAKVPLSVAMSMIGSNGRGIWDEKTLQSDDDDGREILEDLVAATAIAIALPLLAPHRNMMRLIVYCIWLGVEGGFGVWSLESFEELCVLRDLYDTEREREREARKGVGTFT